jgi:predicted oxidoreductase
VSNFTPSQVKLLQSTVPVGVHQLEVSVNEVSAFNDGRLDQCALDGIVPMAWSPLGGGTLPNEMLTVLEPLATAFEVTPQAIALAWLLQHPAGILPVVGTTKSENLEAAQKALNIKLDRQQWYTIYQAATGTTLP